MKHAHSPDVDRPGMPLQPPPPEPVVADQATFSDLVVDGSLPPVAIQLVDRATPRPRPTPSAGSLLTELQCEV